MKKVFFHNLTNDDNFPVTLERIPNINETISFNVRGPLFLIKGITQNNFSEADYSFDIYAIEITQYKWISSMKEDVPY